MHSNVKGGAVVRQIRAGIALVFLFVTGQAFAQAVSNSIVSYAKKISDYEIYVKTDELEFRCRIDKKIVEPKVSSDGLAIIISGTSYVPTADLHRCSSNAILHAIKAAPHVGFLADVNLKARIYASLVPVALNPMSFLVVVAKIGTDRNLINRPGFYRTGIKISTLLSEASSNISPTLSLDARYVSSIERRGSRDK
jgi:hypothetical protein